MRVKGHPVGHSKSLSSENFLGIKIKPKQQRVPTEGLERWLVVKSTRCSCGGPDLVPSIHMAVHNSM